MADDLDRRPTPIKGAIHPWDIGNEEKQEQSKSTSEAQSPAKTDAALATSNVVTPPKEGKLESPSKSERKVSIKSPPESKEKLKDDIPKITQSKSPKSAKGRSKSLGANASDTSDAKALDKTMKIKHSENPPLEIETRKHYVKTRKELVSEAEEESHKHKKQPTARQRILAEFRRKRRPKKKKKYIPNSKKIIKPPAVRESWDNVKSSIAGVFNENKDFKPGSRLSLLSTDDHEHDDDHDGRSTFRSTDSEVSKVGLKKKVAKLTAGQTTANGHLTPIKSALKKGNLNKLKALPAIAVEERGHGTKIVSEQAVSAGVGMSIIQSGGETGRRTIDAASQVGAFDVAVNTDIEKRNVGISTKDDVVFIYETVEVEKKRKRAKHKHRRHGHHRHSHHHHHRQGKNRKGRKYHHHRQETSSSSSSLSSTRYSSSESSSESSSDSYRHHHHNIRRNLRDHRIDDSESRDSADEKPKKVPSAKVRELVDEKALKKSILSQLKAPVHHPLSRSNSKQSADESPRRHAPISRQTSKHAQHEALSRKSSKNNEFRSVPENMDGLGSRQASDAFNMSRRSSSDFDRTPRIDSKGHGHVPVTKVSSNHLPLSRQNSKKHLPLGKTSSKTSSHDVISRQNSTSQPHKPLKRNDSNGKVQVTRTNSSGNPHLSLSRTSSNSSATSSKQPLTHTNSHRLSKQPSNQLGRKLSLVREQPDGKELTPCPHCNRKFLDDRLAIHERVCGKKKAPRKAFDMAKRRLSNFTSANDTYLLKPHNKKGNQNPVVKKKTNWRENHASFMEQVRYAKKVTELEKTGGDISSLGPAPKMSTSHLDQCPKCGRKFNSEAIKKHVPVCKAAPVNK